MIEEVYILVHEEYDYDYYGATVRGVFSTKERAQDNMVQEQNYGEPIPDKRYKSGFRPPVNIHDESCCVIWEAPYFG